MGIIQINQLKRVLLDEFAPHIDVSDITVEQPEQRQPRVLTRALAAFVISKRYGLSTPEAAATIIDGENDNGIDAIAFVSSPRPTLVLLQSKWSEKGKGAVDQASLLKLKMGIELLVGSQWSLFNQRVQSRSEELSHALSVFDLKIEVLFVTTGTGDIDKAIKKQLLDFLSEEFNDGLDESDEGATATFEFLNQSVVYQLLTDDHALPPVDLKIEISDWGRIESPYPAVYGHVPGAAVAEWVKSHGNNLMAGNVRYGLGKTNANDQIFETVKQSPELFWYFNNGITLLCESITKAPAGGSDRRVGTFEFKGLSLVNGAQTASTLLRALKEQEEANPNLRVMIRFISLEKADDDFGKRVTRATNTQNEIGGQDFAALDSVQQRLQRELSIDKYRYILKRGDEVEEGEEGCSFTEAALALASIHSAELATQAKREAGKFWNDISKPPYTTIFGNDISHIRLRRAVELTREIQKAADSTLTEKPTDREKQFVKHGNRLLAFCTSSRLLSASAEIEELSEDKWSDIMANARAAALTTLKDLIEETEEEYKNAYLAALFKNKTKTHHIAKILTSGKTMDV